MPGSAAKVVVTERQQEVLRQMCTASTVPVRLVQHAKVILATFEGKSNEEIAPEVALDRNAVGVWRRRLSAAWSRLTLTECMESHADCRRAIEAVLSDAPRSGNPGRFGPEQITHILALACEPPSKSGRPIIHWTAAELADEAKKRGIVDSISPAQVARYLSEAELQPHL